MTKRSKTAGGAFSARPFVCRAAATSLLYESGVRQCFDWTFFQICANIASISSCVCPRSM